MRRMVRILPLAGLLAVILIVPASPTLGQEAVAALESCVEVAFSTEEDFLTRGPEPPDGNPLISDGDLLGHGCAVCLRNRQLLAVFEVEEDLGLDAADVINVDAGLVAFSTELDHPRGAFMAGDLLTTHGAVIPNLALLDPFDLPTVDLGLDAVHFVGGVEGINAFLAYASEVSREAWLKDPGMLSGMLTEYQIDLWFSTEGTGPWPKEPSFLDGDLLSARDGTIIAGNDILLPAAVPAGIPDRGVDFGLDAVTTDRAGSREIIRFSTEILFTGKPPFTDGDVLLLGAGPIGTNNELTGCFEPLADDLGLDALFWIPKQVQQSGSEALPAPSRLRLSPAAGEPAPAAAAPSVERAATARANKGGYAGTLCDLFPFACKTLHDPATEELSPSHVEQAPMGACSERAFSTEEEFWTEDPLPTDGNPIISDGDLLGDNCVVCARNRELLQAFNVELDLGLDAADVVDVYQELVAFSTELDDPRGQFTGGDLLATNGVAIPNQALLWAFGIDYDMGLDAVYFVGPKEIVTRFLRDAQGVTREEWLASPRRLAEMLKEAGLDLWFSTEGTAPPVTAPGFLDGDLLSVVDGTIVAAQQDLLPLDVPAGLLNRGVDFGLDAVSGERSDPKQRLRFSTELLYRSEWSFTDGDVLVQGDGVEWTNLDLVSPCNAQADFLGLDAYSIGPPCEPSIEVEKQVWKEAEQVITPADIMFVFDATGSMEDEIDEVKSSATNIMSDIRAVIADSRFGLASFADYPHYYESYCGYSSQYGSSGVPDWPYRLDQGLTTDIVAVQGAIGGLTLGSGEDWPEDYTRVLWELGVNDVTDIGWRPAATKIVIMFGDAPTHDCDFYATSYGGDPGPDEIAATADDLDFEAVVAQLAGNEVIVLSVDSSGAPGGDAEQSFKYMAYKTGGAYYPLSDAGEIPKAVKELVTQVFGEWVDEITTVISDTVRFRTTIHNSGTCCPASRIVARDVLSPSLQYRDNATVNGEPWEPMEVAPGEFVWDLGEWVLNPSERIEIEFNAHVSECGVDTNTQEVKAIACGETVSAADTATVRVPCEPSIEVEKQVWREAEEVITPADIMFVFDATGSMEDEIDEVKSSATNIMSDIRAVIADSRFGLASFADYPRYYESYCGYSQQYGSPSVPDWPYRLDQGLTTDIVAVQGAIGGLTLGHGEDWPEDYTRVLWELGVNDVTDVGWRPAATKIVIMFGDAPTHDCGFYARTFGGDPGPDEIAATADDLDFEAVVAQLAGNDVIVLSVDSSNAPGGEAEQSLKYMAYKTGGAYYPLSDAGEIPEAVLELVTRVFGEWVDEITTVVSDTVRFRCTIHNNGTGCPLSQIVATDLLPPSLEYRDNATVNGEPWEPTEVAPKEFVWDLGDWILNPSERIEIEFDAHVIECGEDINTQEVEAIGCDEVVSSADTATVFSAGRADLVISRIICDRANDRIGYRVTNIGCELAAEGHTTELSVDGTSVALDQVTVDLGPGETFEGWFDDFTWPTCRPVDVQVCADVRDTVVEAREDNNCRDGGCISAELEWTWNSTTVESEYDQVMMAPVAADLDGNDIPDIVFSTFKGNNYVSDGILRAIRGDNGTELFSVTSPNYRVKPGGGVAVADIDGDGRPEILANKDPSGVICFEHDGSYKWMTTAPSVGNGGVAVADLDGDGRPEIVARSTVLNNDGTTRWAGTGGGSSAYPVVANLDMTGHPEVFSGDTAYRFDGTVYWRGTHRGNAAVANLDDDNYPEVVIVGADRISVWEHDGVLKWGPLPVPSTGNGPPVIADIDGDGQPEIGVGGYDYYVAYEANLSIKWMAEIRDHSSRAASSTAFDFDGDGAFEILYSDELYHRIFRGADGAVLFQVPGPSGTLLEHPFIVDVDNDDHAEMVAAVNNYAFAGNTGIEVYGNDTCWPDARPIWNEHTYHITNINDDATVPSVETNNWEVHNNYRTQSSGVPEERPMLYIQPASVTTSISGTAAVEIRIQNVTNLYGVQLHLSFDPTIVQVQDAIPGGDTNIAPGDFLDPGAVVYTNYVDNSTGEIQYVQAREGAVPGVDGSGLLARIIFHGESAGTSDLTFTLHILGDPMSVPIAHDYADGEIVVSSAAGAVEGKVILERRVNYPNANAGATVRLGAQTQVTGNDGNYSFSGVPVGTHQISVTHPSYLPTWRNVAVTAGATSTVPDVTMLGGDCSPTQGVIDETDSAVMGLAWGTTPSDADWEARADVRDDGVINVLDYTAVQFNWLRAAPGPWTIAASAAAQGAGWHLGEGSLTPQVAAQTTVVVSPTVVTTSIGAPATVAIWVEDVEDLYAGGFDIEFDPSVVRVQDANSFVDGVQIEAGSWLERQLEAANSVDNATGHIEYSVTQSRPATAKDGSGILARITFVGKTEGISAIQFSRLKLVDDELITIAATAQEGEVVVSGESRIYLPLVLRNSG